LKRINPEGLKRLLRSPMKQYSAIIADDEENLCAHLETLLKKLWPELKIIGIAHSGSEALSLIKQEEPDIAFLDIKMPAMSGLNVAKLTQGFCHVVFISAYDEFAIQAFEQDAIDYLLKPVNENRLLKTIQRLKDDLSLHQLQQPDWQQLILKLSSSYASNDGYIEQNGGLQWIRAGKADKTILIPTDEVLFFKASDKYISVVTTNDEYIIRRTIKDLSSVLDSNHFWQINRGVIVNANYISFTTQDRNGRYNVHLNSNKKVLIASRKYGYLFKQM